MDFPVPYPTRTDLFLFICFTNERDVNAILPSKFQQESLHEPNKPDEMFPKTIGFNSNVHLGEETIENIWKVRGGI